MNKINFDSPRLDIKIDLSGEIEMDNNQQQYK